jgi:Fe-S-cluster-containing dehydrogenase component
MTRWAMVIDTARCVGCQACTIACKTENATPADVWYAPVAEQVRGSYPSARTTFVPSLCNHCKDAPCVKACPTRALSRRPDGIVMYEQKKCCGSRACMNACPYGALHLYEGSRGETWQRGGRPEEMLRNRRAASRFSGRGEKWQMGQRTEETLQDRQAAARYSEGTIQKCTFCAHRIDYGIEHGLVPGIDPEATPACVVTCPAECRVFGDLEDDDSVVNRYLRDRGPTYTLRPEARTGAHVFYVD